jgi:hypothetical protein
MPRPVEDPGRVERAKNPNVRTMAELKAIGKRILMAEHEEQEQSRSKEQKSATSREPPGSS